MNTADRSIAIVDVAVRRRFAFVSMWPDAQVVKAFGGPVHQTAFRLLMDLFVDYAPEDAFSLMPGHSYFMSLDDEEARRIMKTSLVPLLREYIEQGYVAGFAPAVHAYIQQPCCATDQIDAGQGKNTGQRVITFAGSTAHASYDSYSAHAGVGIGRSYTLNEKTDITPSVRADYTWIKEKSYTETGADVLNLSVDGRTTDVVDRVEATPKKHLFWGLVGRLMWAGMPILFAFRGRRTRALLEKP